jgi:hypothetical protein
MREGLKTHHSSPWIKDRASGVSKIMVGTSFYVLCIICPLPPDWNKVNL